MTSRRDFLKDVAGASGLAFVGCGLPAARADAAAAPVAGKPKHAPVIVKGRRIRTVDIHAHCVVPQATALLRREANRPAPVQLLEGEGVAQRLGDMDARGIDFALLSINANWYEADRDVATAVVDLQNDTLAQFCATHKDRFAAYASVALQFPDLAVTQLERAVKSQGMRGVAIGGSVSGQELSDPKFHPFFARAEELGVVVFIHPQNPPVSNDRFKGNGPLVGVVFYPLETTLALTHLIWEGTLDRFPGLKICAAHGGGYLGSYMHRQDHGCTISPNQCAPGVPKKAPSEYLKQMYFDSLVFTPEALRHLVAEVGADRVMVGTDYPFPWVTAPIDHVLDTPGLTDAQREAILGGTAMKLFGLSPA
jgi:aminocarboxymuconate-semialdehyde decarboxylase